LDKEIKNNIAAFGKPATLKGLKELTFRLDTRLEERRLELRQEQGRAGYPSTGHSGTYRTNAPPLANHAKTTHSPAPPAELAPSTALTTPQTGLRVPSHTSDGTVPMELDSNGV
jgi:hypothetical protein